MDITDFYDTFFEEAEELLTDMERYLLELNLEEPDAEQLNAIFRTAHSIKGGAGTFGFEALQKTTHLFENLLDHARHGELNLRRDIVDIFLETKDMLNDQLTAYRNGEEPDQEAFERICKTLQQLAEEEIKARGDGGDGSPGEPVSQPQAQTREEETETASEGESAESLLIALLGISEENRALLVEELEQFGTIIAQSGDTTRYEVELETTTSAADIESVMCFIIEPEQIETRSAKPSAAAEDTSPASEPDAPKATSEPSAPAEVSEPTSPSQQTTAPELAQPVAPQKPTEPKKTASKPPAKPKGGAESSSIRVSVEKVDQIINLVGELIITQSMLDQTVSQLDGVSNGSLVNGMSLLQRNARDLQEAVMSIRMIPMDFVFSRFPRVVRETSSKLGKQIDLHTEGESTELDKSLTERIIDPLTHLVRNSLDHGIETPEEREALGKPRVGNLTLSARHQGGNIIIEVKDDGAGLNRDKLLAKARENGLGVSDSMTDDEVWQLIFAAGFSTAKEVTDVSGRGVGMDVVKRNIQGLGGSVQIMSTAGQGTTIRIVLPLTLAILDGMSIKVGDEIFILPLSTVLQSLQPTKADLYEMAGEDLVLRVRDEYLPVIAVHDALDVAGAQTDPLRSIAVIVQGEGRRYALLIDDLIGQQQVVVKNLETNYRKVPGVSAATILGDGRVALILDIAGLHQLSQRKKEARQTSLDTSAKPLPTSTEVALS
ncbi:chemotaxis protein CheA [Halochromatium roseum]|uniref:chemotaxis protein CheA n=1 Tax=Halochromatium roseum TaxID=391920 RepID=UPI001911F52F|nr:chemotaxis protein CheA [Halochromatium roseum]MBK5939740.1 chemotaxis protein CheA [Halochromatium roseum]